MAPRAGVPRPVPTETVVYSDIFALETLSEELGEIRDAAIVVEGNVIAWVGETSAVPEKYASARRVSMENQVVIPGLINTHHHMYQTLTRCTGKVRDRGRAREGPSEDRRGGGAAAGWPRHTLGPARAPRGKGPGG